MCIRDSQVTKIDQRGDLLRFIAHDLRGIKRKLKLSFSLVIFAPISKQNPTLPIYFVQSFVVSCSLIETLGLLEHSLRIVCILLTQVDDPCPQIRRGVLMIIQLNCLQVILKSLVSFAIVFICISKIYI